MPRPVDVKTDEVYREIGIRSHGKGIFHKTPVSGLELGNKRVFWVEPGDFVLNIVFAWEGAVAVLGEAEQGMIGSHRFPTFRVDKARLDARFLLTFFNTRQGLEMLGRVSPGGAGRNRTLSRAAFLKLHIPLPPLAEQQRVVARIEDVTSQIKNARELRHQANEEASSLWERYASTVFRGAEETHPIRPLGDLVAVRGGGTPSKSNPFYWDGDIPWISPKDMKRRELNDAIDHISMRAVKESSAKLLPPGAVLVVVRGMILVHTVPSAVLRVPAAINQDIKALIPNEELNPEFLCTLFWALNAELVGLVAKSTHDTRKLQTDKLLSTGIVVPPLPEQRRIVTELERLRTEVNTLRHLQGETAAELDALVPAMLDKAFKGDL